MKKNDWLLIASAILFSVLFYKQATGVNYFLFTILVTSVIAYFNPENLKKWQWWYYAFITNFCGFAVLYCNSNLSVFATILSLFVLSGKSFNYKNSIILNLTFSIGSVLSSIGFVIADYVSLRKQNIVSENRKKRKVYFGIFIALIISILFFALYQQANPLFKEFTKNIDLSWISIGWCFFSVFGFLVFYGLVYYRDIKVVSGWDISFNKTLINNKDRNENELSNNTIIALALFGLLNLMLVLVNGLDLTNLMGTHELPKGVYLSDFVHNAVWSLVFSIIIAVGLIIWFFKGELNFNKQSKALKLLVYFWILQSAVMVVSAMIRNSWYVAEYQLTYLRIGVYVFLLLSLVGLFFTFLKISKTKSGWYLVRQNFEAWFLILGICSILNWDKIITDYNISNSKGFSSLDMAYLISLSNANLPEITELQFKNLNDSMFLSKKNYDVNYQFKNLSSKIYDFVINKNEETWQSFNLRDKVIEEKMQVLIENKVISRLSLDYRYDLQLINLSDFYYIKFLSFGNVPQDFDFIAFFENLEELTIGNMQGNSLKKVLHNKNLKKIEVLHYYNGEKYFDKLKLLKKLETISIPTVSNDDLLKLNNHPSLKLLQLKTIYPEQLEFINANRLSYRVEEVYNGDR
ncbi:MAG: DUF4173 domain-containing protein [Bacteroidota bacterium]|nr:DUF4173 domain-containing protein [Bacteroidota bacterium]MDP3144676.1 DUF4173 domain-containing protein [Bacteroidota bacterium]